MLLIFSCIMKQWWSSIPPISTKRSITSLLSWTQCTEKRPWRGKSRSSPLLISNDNINIVFVYSDCDLFCAIHSNLDFIFIFKKKATVMLQLHLIIFFHFPLYDFPHHDDNENS
jgi:hypothetical protein